MPTTIKVCTWNIELGMHLSQVLEVISSNSDFKDVDILALQEASVTDNQQNAKQIAKILGKRYKYFQIDYEKVFGKVQANAIIWNSEKITIETKTQGHLPTIYEEKVPSFEEFLLSKILFLQRRNFIVIKGKMKSIKFKFYVTHLDLIGFKHRFNQLNFILKDTNKDDDALCFIAGDFNTIKVFGKPKWKRLNDDIRKYKFKNITTNLKITHNLLLPQKLDHILVRSKKDFKSNSWILKIKGSDHYPVFAEIII